jgi:chemotaxis signal transduction protein
MQDSLLDRIRELEDELGSLWKQVLEPDGTETAQALRALEVRIGEQALLIRVEHVREVLPMLWPTPVPEAPEWLLGTFEFLGVNVPLIDLYCRLRGQTSRVMPSSKLIVCDSPSWLGLMVEEVGNVIEFDARDLAHPRPDLPISAAVLGTLGRGGGEVAHLISLTHVHGELSKALRP